MRLLRLAVICTAAAMIICLWLFLHAIWYTFVLFMLVAQPLLAVAAGLFAWVVLRELRERGVL